ncbi:DUF6090 family protein [bacterium]|nr:DUF6090 family protein [bacterium]
MLKFFRKIRQKLIDEGNLKRYLIYAIGEVLLVVVGILIALQINNWNEENKRLRKSHEILDEIKRNIESNTVRFQDEIEVENKVISSIDIVLQNITQTKIYHDSLDKHLHLSAYWPTSHWQTSGYETLKSQGVELIQSEALRESIINLYEISYADISEVIRTSEGYSFSTLIPVSSELFIFAPANLEQSVEEFRAKPIDYRKVLQHKQYNGILSFWRVVRIAAIQLRLNAIDKNRDLIDAINVELEKN